MTTHPPFVATHCSGAHATSSHRLGVTPAGIRLDLLLLPVLYRYTFYLPTKVMNSSPRTSVDTAHSPSSPLFLHSITHRLRKGSTASRTSSQFSEASISADVDRNQDARSAKRYLQSLVRDDWEYPVIQSHKDDLRIQRDPSGYRFREESLSEYESEDRKRWAGHEDDPYRFETPDDVSAMIEKRKARRKRLLEQEMSWNDGLRTWTLRRDAWTGAVAHKPRSPSQGSNKTPPKRTPKERAQRNSSESTGRSSSSAPSWPLPTPQERAEPQDPSDNLIPTTSNSDQQDQQDQQDHPDGPYLPIYPPLLPASHTLRSRIRPTAYPTIYSKVVIMSLTPNVPIPLNHMIGALVAGWKLEGNWPPQPSEPVRTATRRKQKKNETAFQKWKCEQEEKRKAAAAQANEVQWVQEEPEHKGMRRSITNAMKKMLGSGSSEQAESSVDQDLEKLGLTFESDQERQHDTAQTLDRGHI